MKKRFFDWHFPFILIWAVEASDSHHTLNDIRTFEESSGVTDKSAMVNGSAIGGKFKRGYCTVLDSRWESDKDGKGEIKVTLTEII